MGDNYKDLILKTIFILKQEVQHEGTGAVISPTQLLDKIASMSRDMPDIQEFIYDKKG